MLKHFLFLLDEADMDVIVPGIVLYQKNQMVGKNYGGNMHSNLFYQMSARNWRKHHGDTFHSGCKYILHYWNGSF